MNWLLVSEIFSAMSCMELNHNWDLDCGENAKLAESFYTSLKDGYPKTVAGWEEVFERAAVATWGPDHKCDAWKLEEIKTFVWSLDSSYYAIQGVEYGHEDRFLTYTRELGIPL